MVLYFGVELEADFIYTGRLDKTVFILKTTIIR
jgi:hypothetical protein